MFILKLLMFAVLSPESCLSSQPWLLIIDRLRIETKKCTSSTWCFYEVSHHKHIYLYSTATTIPSEELKFFANMPRTIWTIQHLTVTLTFFYFFLFMRFCPGTITTHAESINSDLQRGLDRRLRHTQH